MGLDLYFHGEKELSPKSYKERSLIEQLNKYPFTKDEWKQLKQVDDENDYLYVSEWSNTTLHTILNERPITGQIGHVKGLTCKRDKMGNRHWTIITESWYLRKANAIHKWFVDNAQNGVDDCGYYPIDDVLDDFIVQASDVLNGHVLADEGMPTQSGFFFGGTEYDDWYYKELKNTIARFKRFKAKFRKGKWNYFYHSSW